jgi:hypothetical protein
MKVVRPFLQGSLIVALSCSVCAGFLWAEPAAGMDMELPAILKAKPLEKAPKDDELQQLLKSRYNESVAVTAGNYMGILAGREGLTLDVLLGSARRLRHAGVELYLRPEEQMNFLKQLVELSNTLEKVVDDQVSKGRFKKIESNKMREFKLELEIMMLKVKKAGTEKGK